MWRIVVELGIVVIGVLVGREMNWMEDGEVEVVEVGEVGEVVSLNGGCGSVSAVGIVASCISSGHESQSNSGFRKFFCDDDKQ